MLVKAPAAANLAPGETPAATPANQHWFWKYVLASRRIYIQVIVASVFINLFALASAMYIMVVYDRVIPNNAIESLWAMTLIVVLIMGFDFSLKIIRGMFVDTRSTNGSPATSSTRSPATISACRGRPPAPLRTRCGISRR